MALVAPEKLIAEMMGGGLRALAKLADSTLVERFGLERRTQKWVSRGVKRAAETARRLTPKPSAGARESRKFDLRLSEEQQLMRETLRRFADRVVQPAAREADDRLTPPEGLLDAFSELGAVSMTVPERLGGAAESLSAVSQMLIAEDLARGDMGLAYASLSSLSFVKALTLWGDPHQQAAFLPSFLGEGSKIGTVATVEPHPFFDPNRLRTVARRQGSKLRLHGEKSMVALAAEAKWFLVAADVMAAGPRFVLVDRNANGVRLSPDPSMGLRSASLGRVVFDDVEVSTEALLGGPACLEPSASTLYDAAVDRARIAWGAMALGTSQALLDYVIPYCNERIAFGEPISHRQAVAFMIANIAIELESMRMLVYRAAARVDAGLNATREAYLARVLCVDKAMAIGTDGVQLLGGAGFIKDHPVEIWYRHLRAIAVMDGNLVV